MDQPPYLLPALQFFEGGEVWKENEEWRQQQRAARQGPAQGATPAAGAADASLEKQPLAAG
jgi:hypothetical protein